MKKTIFLIFLFLIGESIVAQDNFRLQDTIINSFAELKSATGKAIDLWGIDLFGPVLLVNANTRQVFANYPDSAGVLTKNGELYQGLLPPSINIANTSIDWNGQRWAMVMLPLPAEKFDRINLLSHELFHKSQPVLGFELFNPDNNHLDQKEGRIYLKLELAALRKAVSASSKALSKSFLADALAFRKYRYSIFPGAEQLENKLELNEGLAEYTGLMISSRNPKLAIAHLNNSLKEFLSNPTFVRSFAYQTIPIYGYLLSNIDKKWTKNITASTNLTSYFLNAFKISLNGDLKTTIDKQSSKYEGEKIFAEEMARDQRNKALIKEYLRKFVEQPHFEIHFEQMNVSYDPRNIMPLEDKGTVYPNIKVSDKWGILTVTNGALMSPNWDKISITSPIKNDSNSYSGDGWTLTLDTNYSLIKDRNNNYQLKKN